MVAVGLGVICTENGPVVGACWDWSLTCSGLHYSPSIPSVFYGGRVFVEVRPREAESKYRLASRLAGIHHGPNFQCA